MLRGLSGMLEASNTAVVLCGQTLYKLARAARLLNNMQRLPRTMGLVRTRPSESKHLASSALSSGEKRWYSIVVVMRSGLGGWLRVSPLLAEGADFFLSAFLGRSSGRREARTQKGHIGRSLLGSRHRASLRCLGCIVLPRTEPVRDSSKVQSGPLRKPSVTHAPKTATGRG